MNMTSINSSISYFQSQQTNYQKKTASETVTSKEDHTAMSKPVEVTANSLTVEKTTGYDLKNITPQETYELANKLHDEGAIGGLDFAIMMAIGCSNQYPPTNGGAVQPNDAPYNLLNELESMASGTGDHWALTPAYTQGDAQNLFDFFSDLQSATEKITYNSIDIKV